MEELWEKLSQAQLYTNSFEDFKNKYGSAEAQEELYTKLNNAELYTNSLDDFKNKYFVEKPLGPVSEAALTEAAEKQKQQKDMASKSEDGSSVSAAYDIATSISEAEELAIGVEAKELDFTPVKMNYAPMSVPYASYMPQKTQTYYKQPYEEYLKRAEKDLKQNPNVGYFKLTEGFTPEEIQQRARDIYKRDKKYSLLTQKNKDFLSNISPEEKEKLYGDKVDRYKEIDKDYEDEVLALELAIDKYTKGANIKNLEFLNKALSDPEFNFDITQTVKEGKEVVTLQDGRKIPKEVLDDYEKAFNTAKEFGEYVEAASDKLYKEAGEMEDLPTAINFLKKNYDYLDKLQAITETGIGQAGLTAYRGLIDAAQVINDLGGYGVMKGAIDEGLKSEGEEVDIVLAESNRALQEDYAAGVAFKEAFNNPENFGKFTAEALAGQVGNIASVAASGPAAPYVIGLQGYGRKISDINTDDKKKGIKTGDVEKRLTALGFGAFEATLGTLPTMRILKNAKFNLGSVSSNRSFYKGVGDFVKVNYKPFVNNQITESVGEGATQFFQNGIEVARGKMSLENITDGVAESAFTGGLLGVTLQGAPLVKGAVLSSLANESQYKGFDANVAKIASLQKAQESLESNSEAFKSNAKLIEDLQADNSVILDRIENNISSKMDAEGFELYKAATAKQSQIIAQANAIQNSDKSIKQKEQELAPLQQEFNVMEAQRKRFKKNFKNVFSIESKAVRREYLDKASELNEDLEGNKLEEEAKRLYNIDKVNNRNTKAVKSVKALAKSLGVNVDLAADIDNKSLVDKAKDYYDLQVENGDLTQSKADKDFAEIKEAIESGAMNGVALGDKKTGFTVLISPGNMLKNGRTDTAAHELGHVLFIDMLSKDQKAYEPMASAILEYLKDNNKKAYDRISLKSTENKKLVADEVIMNFIEEASSGRLDLEKNKGVFAIAGLAIRKILGKQTGSDTTFGFEGPQDVQTFLKDVAKGLRDGTLAAPEIKSIKNTRFIKEGINALKGRASDLEGSIPFSKAIDINQALIDLEDKAMDGEISFDEYEAQVAVLEQKLEAAEKEAKLEKPKPKKSRKKSEGQGDMKKASSRSKEILDKIGNDPEGFNKNDPRIYDILSGIIKSKSKVFKTKSNKIVNLTALPGFEMDNMVSETVANMIPYIAKFDPFKNNSLYGYINAQLNNRMKAALKSGKVTDAAFTDDVTEIKGLASPVVEQSAPKTAEKPKYTKLIDSDIVSPNVIKTITDKLVSTVRVLKNRIDANVSKNVNTIPLMSEILNDISKQVDIDLKTAMGGKKDGRLESFLRKNKKAILENLTTTFLQGKDTGDKVLGGIPIAIQKQVDGKMLSYPDWVGKKIDRETTLGRGNTSGVNIVRRVKAEAIPTAEFLKYFLEPTGNPIRGRKEALAKELGGEIALEILAEETLAGDGAVFEAFAANQERLGVDINDSLASKVAMRVERGTIKFSKKADIENVLLKAIKDAKDSNSAGYIYYKAAYANLEKAEGEQISTEEFKSILAPDHKELNLSLKEMREFSAILWGKLLVNDAISTTSELFNEAANIFEKYIYQKKEVAVQKSMRSYAKAAKTSKRPKAVLLEFVSTFGLSIRADKLNGIVTSEQLFAQLEKEFGKKLVNDTLYLQDVSRGKSIFVKSTKQPARPLGSASVTKKAITKAIKKGEDPFVIADNYNKAADEARGLMISAIDSMSKTNSVEDVLEFIRLINGQHQDNIIRRLSKFKGIEAALIDKRNTNSLGETIWEHETEAKEIEGYIREYAESKRDAKAKAKLNSQLDGSFVNLVSKDLDNKLRATGEKGIKRYEVAKADIVDYMPYESSITKAEAPITVEKKSFSLSIRPDELYDWKHYDREGASVATTTYNGTEFHINSIDTRVYDMPSKYNSKIKQLLDESNLDEAAFLMGGDATVVEFDESGGSMKLTNRMGAKSIGFLRVLGGNIVELLKSQDIHGLVFTAENEGRRRSVYETFASALANKLGWDAKFKDGAYIIFDPKYKSFNKADFTNEFETDFINDLDPFDFDPNISYSKAIEPSILDREFNLMLERKKGIKAGLRISKARAEQLGAKKGRFRYFIPPNTEDFTGLLYNFLGKGKQGDKDFAFFRKTLIDPFNYAENKISAFRQELGEKLRLLKKEMGNIDKDINPDTIKKIEELGFTPDQAVRIFIWNRRVDEIPDLTDQERAKILSIVRRDVKLMKYARELMKLTESFGGYPPPGKNWFAGNSRSDLYKFANENVRAKFLAEWQSNADAVFSKENMIKLQALYGKGFVSDLKQILRRMKSGSNRPVGMNDSGSKFLDYINGSVGVIMFLNVRSAVLQTLSSVNFINWHDNNIFKAGKTLGSPKEFGKTFLEIMNSDFLKQRRDGLEINVSEAEIANAVQQSKNKAKALFAGLMKAGYKPTQFADSFAIAIGGTPFLINRTKTYIKQGLTKQEAQEKAFTDFREIAEENQQSSRTDKTSNIQASPLGRLIFAFNNTPFQYTRIMKKAFLDLANGRGDIKTNISKILYYGAVQNFIFYALQQALMAATFGGDEDEQKDLDSRISRMGNGMLDTILRGSGLPGAVVSMGKNVILEYIKQEEKGSFRADHGKTLIQMLNISPPVGSKATRIYSGIKGAKYEETTMDMLKNKSKIIAAITNIPVDRLVSKADNLSVAATQPIESWKRAALLFGWDQWSLGVYDDLKVIEGEANQKPKKSRSEIMKEVWRKRKEEDRKERAKVFQQQARNFK